MKTKSFLDKYHVRTLLIVSCASALVLCGCAQFKAMDQPKPFKPTATVVGAKRVNVAGELGSPVNSEEANGHLVDTYKYVDGGGKNATGSKVGRVILYTAGDLFTLFLDQLITWPTESVAFAGTPHVVTVEYAKDTDGFWHVVSVTDVEQVNKKKTDIAQSPRAKSNSPSETVPDNVSKTQPTSTNSPPQDPKP